MRKLTALLAAGLVLGTSGMAMAVNSASINAGASATVIAPLYVVETTALNFGKFSPGNSGTGTVTISTADARGTTGTVQLADAAGSVPKAGWFTVTGQADLLYDITVAAASTLTNGTPAVDMIATLTKSKSSGTLTLGTDTFLVSASLAVAAAQPAAAYAGTYAVSVVYQ